MPTQNAAAEAKGRETIALDGVWDFQFGDSDAWRKSAVPAVWQAEFADLRTAFGRARHRRTFSLPQEWAGKRVMLRFGAVNYFAEVLVNGRAVGTHEGGYLPFSFIIPHDFLRPENELEVVVTLPSADANQYPQFPFSEIPHGKQSWYGPLGGIWQSVVLEQCGECHIEHVKVDADLASGVVDFDLELSGDGGGYEATVAIVDPDGVEVARVSSSGASLRATIANIKAWSPDTPALYRADLILSAGGTPIDRTSVTFGFRTFEARDGRLYLNGAPFYMRAALDQDYYPAGICTPPSLEFLEDQARKAKALGLNTLRIHIKIPDPRYYEVADRLGLVIWTEIPNVQIFTEASARRMRETMAGILRRDGHHPSIVAWTIINEDWGTRLVENEDHRRWLADTYDWLKALDPTRLVSDNSACFPNFHVKSDMNDYHYYRSVPERLGEWDELTKQFAGGASWTYSSLGDAQWRGDEPLIVSEFGVWGLPDPSKLLLDDGSEPFWMETGATWGDGVAYPHGIQTRFNTLHLDGVFKDFGAFIEAVQWYQFDNLKYQIEVMRSYPSIVGYVITEFTDVHWEANGLLDMNRNPRVFHDVFPQVNADLVIIARPAAWAVYAGDVLDVDVSVATGGGEIPDGAILKWSYAERGERALPAAGPNGLSKAGTLKLPIPESATNERLRIVFEVISNGVSISTNFLDISVYAKRQATRLPSVTSRDPELLAFAQAIGYPIAQAEAADIHLAHALDSDDIEKMREGARYLVIADGSVATHRNLRTDVPAGERLYREMIVNERNMPVGIDQQLPGIGLIEREGTMWRGDWIANFSWIRRKGAFASIPGGPLLDLSFEKVVPHHVMTGFRTFEFAGPVHGGVVIGWLHKPAVTIAERSVGRGSLLATTFRLTSSAPGSDPVAVALFDAMTATIAQRR
ncbi:glycoside hydrolase family 2 (plasmid) [Rhizobium grahamii]|uniref:Glycoside hydrolase family 2 n=1 Tax=Rhizobium grahamii TaxID=1120045 RepID=A0A5Q0CHU1_9HYPH|nr:MULTISPECIES: sugar-binding domain-containing protein [Rhizobium]QFY63981.1 glycoside hydrolase family 2 [Rhizobium grahamii]QRM52775.1 glycoside hydrolase family 2 [Rhizobium sp. BG6]